MTPKKSVFELARALGGIPVLGSLPGSPAERAGIRYGDVILSVNGMKTPTVVEYVEAKALRKNGMSVTVFRSGEDAAVDLEYAEPGPDTPMPDVAAILSELIAARILPSSEGDGNGNGGGVS